MSSSSRPTSGFRARVGRVLVIDDEHLVGVALSRVLYREYEVVVCTRAAEAIARLNAGERYDVVFCDLRMPIMDGLQFHRLLSVTLPAEADRIVFITAAPLSPRAEAFFQRAPNLLMSKPLDVDGVRHLIERRYRTAASLEVNARR
jgi:CheY-like chemotaxis protein